MINAGSLIDHDTKKTRKPNPHAAMRQLITEARARLPFDRADAGRCDGDCGVCTVKLLASLEDQLEWWTARLDAGVQPSLGELAALGRLCREVARATDGRCETSGASVPASSS